MVMGGGIVSSNPFAFIEEILNSFMTEVPDLQSKSMDWFLYDRDLPHERVQGKLHFFCGVFSEGL